MKKQSLFFLSVCMMAVGISACDDGDNKSGQSCRKAADCGDTTLYTCDTKEKMCVLRVPENCINKIKDADETDVDCGGSCVTQVRSTDPRTCINGQGCKVNTDCASNSCENSVCTKKGCTGDRDDECPSGLHCDTKEQVCVGCKDGEANGDETDVDCGGTYCSARCAVSQKCKIPTDCLSGKCESGICQETDAKPASPEDLVINEVLNTSKSTPAFSIVLGGNNVYGSSAAACNFVEIANTKAERLNLEGLTLVFTRDASEKAQAPISIPLSGVIQDKNIAVVHTCDSLKLPEGVIGIKVDAIKITGSATYDITLEKDGVKSEAARIKFSQYAASYNRVEDFNGKAEFTKTTDIPKKASHATPGYCVNGGQYHNGCATHCTNGKPDEDETGVDCGGALCEKCAGDVPCKKNSDCEDGFCWWDPCEYEDLGGGIYGPDKDNISKKNHTGRCMPCIKDKCDEGYVCIMESVNEEEMASSRIKAKEGFDVYDRDDKDHENPIDWVESGTNIITTNYCVEYENRETDKYDTYNYCKIVPKCNNGKADDNESDEDCGGVCGPTCVKGKICGDNSDCLSNVCTDGICAGDDPESADVTQLVINEVYKNVSGDIFPLNRDWASCNFVEIYNKSEVAYDLTGYSIVIYGIHDKDTEQSRKWIKLNGSLQGHHVLVVHSCDNIDLPSNARGLKPSSWPGTNYKTDYDYYIVKDKTESDRTKDKNNELPRSALITAKYIEKDSTSLNRKKDGIDTQDNGDTINRERLERTVEREDAVAIATPGYCSNGGLFPDCNKDYCKDDVINGNESDKNCGGNCGRCEDGKKCIEAMDCAPGAGCHDGICVPKCGVNLECCTVPEIWASANNKSGACPKDKCKIADGASEGTCAYFPTCDDGVKYGNDDHHETGVDCGGDCGRCPNGEGCDSDDDCLSDHCSDSKVCDGNYMEKATAEDLLINEVMAAPDTKLTFGPNIQTVTEGSSLNPQCDFIEIVNLTDQKKMLDGNTLKINRVDKEGGVNIDLAGILPASGALLILAKNCDLNGDVPDDVLVMHSGADNFLTGSPAKYDLWINNDIEHSVRFEPTKTGYSAFRHPDGNAASELLSNTRITPANTPGYCANGGTFSTGCEVNCGGAKCKGMCNNGTCETCSDGIRNQSESDVDCGGICNSCSEGNICIEASDCVEGVNCVISPDNENISICRNPRCTDTDAKCGGDCEKCDNGKICEKGSDCLSNQCEGRICTGAIPEPARVQDLVINEVRPRNVGELGEFVEIVNVSDKPYILDDITLQINKMALTDGTIESTKNVALRGTVKPKGVILVSNNSSPSIDATYVSLTTNSIVDKERMYQFVLVDSQGNKSRMSQMPAPSAASDYSYNLATDIVPDDKTEFDELVKHGPDFSSPGYCMYGAVFEDDCKCGKNYSTLCKNEVGCDNGDDCLSGYCRNDSTCDDKPLTCTDNERNCGGECEQCLIGGVCNRNWDCHSDYCEIPDGAVTGVCKAPLCGDTPCDGTCNTSGDTPVCETCLDGIKNQDEVTVDCGGVCGREGGDDLCYLVINEVMGKNTSEVGEFVEIVNTSDKEIAIGQGSSLVLYQITLGANNTYETPSPNAGWKKAIPLSNTTVPAHGVIVVSTKQADPNGTMAFADDVKWVKLDTSAISDSSPYFVALRYAALDGIGYFLSRVTIESPDSNKVSSSSQFMSYNRKEDGVGGMTAEPLSKHPQLQNFGSVYYSPGFCANGNLFSNNCLPKIPAPSN